ncbi:hypothetical protein CYMTET_31416 [Cymbomonas tetramitiformis]|uniref:Uncharacterized protein n=1 Tax=Cymbomonas tetramitiformis TaxID=36881 RepID=A0AAE0KSX5_9CHLO|nr:hypothetical protein CYMTET_31416 [Cymbomonas tetramitiformis]
MAAGLQGEALGRHNVLVQSEGGGADFPAINVGLVYVQRATAGGGAEWFLRELIGRIRERLFLEEPIRCVDGNPAMGAIWEQNIFNEVVEAAACACRGRPHRALHCTFPNETAFKEDFKRLHHTEYRWYPEDHTFSRPTPTVDPRLLTSIPADYAVHWHPLFTDPAQIERREELASHDSIALAPTWLFNLMADTDGWIAARPQPVVATHYVVFPTLKRAFMQMFGAWHPHTPDAYHLATQGGKTSMETELENRTPLPKPKRLLALKGPGRRHPDRLSFAQEVALLVDLATAARRTPVVPLVSCDSAWIVKSHNGYKGHRRGLLEDIITAPCYFDLESNDSAATCCYFVPHLRGKCVDIAHVPELPTMIRYAGPGGTRTVPLRDLATDEAGEVPAKRAAEVLGGQTSIVLLDLEGAAYARGNTSSVLPRLTKINEVDGLQGKLTHIHDMCQYATWNKPF